MEKMNCFATLIMNYNLPTFVLHCYWFSCFSLKINLKRERTVVSSLKKFEEFNFNQEYHSKKHFFNKLILKNQLTQLIKDSYIQKVLVLMVCIFFIYNPTKMHTLIVYFGVDKDLSLTN